MTIEQLIARCKCGVYLTVNEHRDFYQSVAEYLADQINAEEIPPDVRDEMVANDSVIELQFYPNTPVGFYRIWGPSLEFCLKEAGSVLGEGKHVDD